MGDPAPILRVCGELKSQKLLFGEDVPEPEIHPQTAVHDAGLAVHQGLSLDLLPGCEIGLNGDVQVAFGEAGRVQGAEQAAALKVGRDDPGDVGAGLSAERRHRDGQGLDVTAIDVDLDLGPSLRGNDRHRCHAQR